MFWTVDSQFRDALANQQAIGPRLSTYGRARLAFLNSDLTVLCYEGSGGRGPHNSPRYPSLARLP